MSLLRTKSLTRRKFSIICVKKAKSSKSAFARLIRNPIYCGDILVGAFEGEKETARVSHKKVNGKFPLKGFVLCPNCGNLLLASSSRGRSKYYSYYHCSRPCDTRYKVEDVEKWFQGFLGSTSLNENTQQLLFEMIRERIKSQTKQNALGGKTL